MTNILYNINGWPCIKSRIEIECYPHQFPRKKNNVVSTNFKLHIWHELKFDAVSIKLLWATLIGLFVVVRTWFNYNRVGQRRYFGMSWTWSYISLSKIHKSVAYWNLKREDIYYTKQRLYIVITLDLHWYLKHMKFWTCQKSSCATWNSRYYALWFLYLMKT